MSATKIYDLKLSFSIFLLLTLFSCNQSENQKKPVPENNDKITLISLSHIGGSSGSYKIIKITEDSIHSEQGIAAHKTHKEWHSAISVKTWEKLTSLIDAKTLDHIKSSPSIQFIDGIDETFQIRTSKKSHVYVNAYHDTAHYKQLQNFKTQLEKILPKEYQ